MTAPLTGEALAYVLAAMITSINDGKADSHFAGKWYKVFWLYDFEDFFDKLEVVPDGLTGMRYESITDPDKFAVAQVLSIGRSVGLSDGSSARRAGAWRQGRSSVGRSVRRRLGRSVGRSVGWSGVGWSLGSVPPVWSVSPPWSVGRLGSVRRVLVLVAVARTRFSRELLPRGFGRPPAALPTAVAVRSFRLSSGACVAPWRRSIHPA